MSPFLLLFLCFSLTFGDESVKFAAVIFRHGDRTPVDPYPNDPWKEESLWPQKFGELTNVGKMQHYALGTWLRKRYAHFLSSEFDPTEIYIRSTDVDRTLMSVQANLAGMYPPLGKNIWNSNLMWQPIPVHTVPEKNDEVLAMKKPCPAYDEEYSTYIHSKAYKQRLNKYKDLMKYLAQHSGMEVSDYYDVDDIYSTLYIETLYNFTLPNWTHSVYPDKMYDPACYSFTTETGTPLLARLKVGPLLKQIISHMNNALLSQSTKHRKLFMYSGHDITVGSMLNALGLYDGNCPVYTATIIIELINDNATSTNYIRISYRNSTEIVEPHVLNIPYCGEKCPIEKFVKLYENLLTVDWEKECGKQFPPLLAGSFVVGLCLFGFIYVLHKLYFKRVYRQVCQDKIPYMSVQNHPELPVKV